MGNGFLCLIDCCGFDNRVTCQSIGLASGGVRRRQEAIKSSNGLYIISHGSGRFEVSMQNSLCSEQELQWRWRSCRHYYNTGMPRPGQRDQLPGTCAGLRQHLAQSQGKSRHLPEVSIRYVYAKMFKKFWTKKVLDYRQQEKENIFMWGQGCPVLDFDQRRHIPCLLCVMTSRQSAITIISISNTGGKCWAKSYLFFFHSPFPIKPWTSPSTSAYSSNDGSFLQHLLIV